MLEKSTTHVYPFTGESEERTHAQSVNYVKKACARKEENARTTDCSEFGVKGISELYLLPSFDMIAGFSCDAIHFFRFFGSYQAIHFPVM